MEVSHRFAFQVLALLLLPLIGIRLSAADGNSTGDCYWSLVMHVMVPDVVLGRNSTTVSECQAECLRTPRCVAIEWDPDEDPGSYCCLLSKQTNKVYTSRNVSHYDLRCKSHMCPSSGIWNPKTGSCYHVIQEAASYDVAKQKCDAISAKLAPLYSIPDLAFYGKLINASRGNCSKAENCSRYWVNMEDMLQDQYDDYSMYAMYDYGTDSRKSFSNVCGYAYTIGNTDSANWDVTNCQRSMRYICSIIIDCPEGYVRDPWSQFCYKLMTTKTNWPTAFAACHNSILGSRLAVFSKVAELLNAVRQVNTKFKDAVSACYAGYYQKNSYWIGARTKDPKNCSSPYVWTPTYSETLSKFGEYWVPGQPDCSNGIENCVHLSGGYGYRMNDEVCDTFLACPLCQRRMDPHSLDAIY